MVLCSRWLSSECSSSMSLGGFGTGTSEAPPSHLLPERSTSLRHVQVMEGYWLMRSGWQSPPSGLIWNQRAWRPGGDRCPENGSLSLWTLPIQRPLGLPLSASTSTLAGDPSRRCQWMPARQGLHRTCATCQGPLTRVTKSTPSSPAAKSSGTRSPSCRQRDEGGPTSTNSSRSGRSDQRRIETHSTTRRGTQPLPSELVMTTRLQAFYPG
mmetsp:Transcript_72884/g.159258  ORF Transcript_72884/g.159258 Transcript_72884/m.159258 type:complete len:211 (+) Transcript_72884:1485-2117(+)